MYPFQNVVLCYSKLSAFPIFTPRMYRYHRRINAYGTRNILGSKVYNIDFNLYHVFLTSIRNNIQYATNYF